MTNSKPVRRNSVMRAAFERVIEHEVAILNASIGETNGAQQHKAAEGIDG